MPQEDSALHQLPAGTVLNNRFEIVHLLGEGGFGITYLGQDNVLQIPVAIKEYYPKGYASRIVTQNLTVTITDKTKNEYFAKWKTKFLTEARMLAKFANLPGIVNVRDFFEQNGTAYIIMEYLDSITLKNYVEAHGPMDPGTFFKRLIPVLTSLEKIHQQGLIHRDISPDNLMLMDDGFLKLYDFGAAREFSDATQSTFSVIIKPCFAPEEQYRSKGKQGPWTDIYSICATIYFSIMGVLPDDSLQRVFSDELKKPSELGVNLPPRIEAALLKGMSVRSDDRFKIVQPLISAFEEADFKAVKKKGFGKEKNPKSKKVPNIFSLFHTTSHQASVTPPFTSVPIAPVVTNSANEKTEIILTQYEPSDNDSHNSVENEVKRRHRPDLSNDQVSSQITSDNIIHNEPEVSQNDNRQAVQSVQQVSANYSKQNSSVDFTSSYSTAAEKNKTDNTLSGKYRSKENEKSIACPKCNTVLPHTAKFCGFCGIPLQSFKSDQSSSTLPSADKPIAKTSQDINNENAAKNISIMCPRCKTILPASAKFCGMCGVKFLISTTN